MLNPANDNGASATAEAVALRSRGKLIAYLAARFRDVAAAEDALSEAFASALSVWPQQGCPDNPEAWLLTAARRKLIDQLRRNRETSTEDEPEHLADAIIASADDGFPDRRLALLFTCAHPSINVAMRAPLMLQVVLGLEAAQIASAFLVSPTAMAQRLVRAKTKIREAHIPFRIPERHELPDRLQSVLDSIYAGFAEGWLDATGSDSARRELAGEAIYLGRLLTQLLPDEPEARGLLALMLYAEARRPARRTAQGEFIPLRSQDTTLWDWTMIEEAEAALRLASGARRIGRYQLEAALQSAHVEGTHSGSVSWDGIVSLYDALVELTRSPVASINRAIAVAELRGPYAGLAALEDADEDQRISSYQPYWAARANLLGRTGSYDAARHAYQLAIGLESDPAVREYLRRCCDDLPC
ncbi:MAG: RNA polymerase subunit sigma-70 [Acidobacteriota bacterium]|nr:RNA polymerase subunit sigma-70 [Acidobacteriota bacterium]